MKHLSAASVMASALFAPITGLSFDVNQIETLASIKTSSPAFLYLDKYNDNNELLITKFKLFGQGGVASITDIGTNLTELDSRSIATWPLQVTWPNEVSRAPSELFGEDVFAIAGGFLVPGKSNGAITMFNRATGRSWEVTSPKRGYWYHKIVFTDMDRDGHLDILTARATKPIFGGGRGEILWLRNPATDSEQPWEERIIMKGPDVNFQYTDLDHDGVKEIIATEFWGERLSISWRNPKTNTWQYRVVDGSLGSGFNLQIVDLNNDGNLDVLATNHQSDASAAIIAYEIPTKIRTAIWTKHILLDGIKTRNRGIGQGSPGSAEAVFPDQDRQQKPIIIAAGDGSQRVHLLTPVNQQADSWLYNHHHVLDAKGTVGHIAIGDVDNDGRLEMFVPSYDQNEIYILRL